MFAEWSLIATLKGHGGGGSVHMLGLRRCLLGVNYSLVRPASSFGLAVLDHKPKSYPLPPRWRRCQV